MEPLLAFETFKLHVGCAVKCGTTVVLRVLFIGCPLNIIENGSIWIVDVV